MNFRFFLLCLAVSFFPLPAAASGVERLKNFVQQTQSARASFTQTVLDRNGRPLQQASGTMQFSRPGKFRWVYDKPSEQVIVGDGEKLWVYDNELNQVTVKKLDQSIGASPAALLAGSNEIEAMFSLKDSGRADGLEWLEAQPKGQEGSFQSVRMGFNATALQVMELRDNFGQTTVIRFGPMERNPRIAAEQFRFTPPKGADVIGE